MSIIADGSQIHSGGQGNAETMINEDKTIDKNGRIRIVSMFYSARMEMMPTVSVFFLLIPMRCYRSLRGDDDDDDDDERKSEEEKRVREMLRPVLSVFLLVFLRFVQCERMQEIRRQQITR